MTLIDPYQMQAWIPPAGSPVRLPARHEHPTQPMRGHGFSGSAIGPAARPGNMVERLLALALGQGLTGRRLGRASSPCTREPYASSKRLRNDPTGGLP
jgi:hypothetical protein